MGRILIVDDNGGIILQGLLAMGNNGEIIVIDDASEMTQLIQRDILPHLPLPERESKEIPYNKKKNWKKKKYYGRG